VRFAIFAASLDEDFNGGADRPVALEVSDPTIVVRDPADILSVVSMVSDQVGTAVNVTTTWDEGSVPPLGSEVAITWTHTTRSGRSYKCSVYVLLDE
jgi:hypothetical protein